MRIRKRDMTWDDRWDASIAGQGCSGAHTVTKNVAQDAC